LGICVAAVIGAAFGFGCSLSNDAFQPITTGAKPWTPPAGWNPQMAETTPGPFVCVVGNYIAITGSSCAGCGGVLSYALCTGSRYDQCSCGRPYTPGATCPQEFVCATNDFPPQNWTEFTDYDGTGWAGYGVTTGSGTGTGTGTGTMGTEAGTDNGD
jgi:hypothetical protein